MLEWVGKKFLNARSQWERCTFAFEDLDSGEIDIFSLIGKIQDIQIRPEIYRVYDHYQLHSADDFILIKILLVMLLFSFTTLTSICIRKWVMEFVDIAHSSLYSMLPQIPLFFWKFIKHYHLKRTSMLDMKFFVEHR